MIELHLAVMAENGVMFEVQPCEGTTCEEASKEWESEVVRICHIVLEDERTPTRNAYSHMESAYGAVEALDAAYGYPCLRDLLMHFFKEGFKEGVKHQSGQGTKSPTVIQEGLRNDEESHR